VVSAGSYVLGALSLVAVGLSIGFSAYRLRRKLLPAWDGAPARLVESVTALALLIWLGELLGTFGLLYAWTLVAAAALLAVLAWTLLPAGPVAAGDPPPPAVAKASSGAVPPATPPAAPAAEGQSAEAAAPAEDKAEQVSTPPAEEKAEQASAAPAEAEKAEEAATEGEGK
jgi:hypothetical protein